MRPRVRKNCCKRLPLSRKAAVLSRGTESIAYAIFSVNNSVLSYKNPILSIVCCVLRCLYMEIVTMLWDNKPLSLKLYLKDAEEGIVF